ncbi:MAG: DNA polymerase III subunit [Chloroherpetonaceae bacterium]|nr:AAA family ATPase [Chloroherpetonaceae bacterium]MCS7211493.1 AAA family ATPase [Chloroherpetonaceae bacterium]MDW8018925.1 DNA polymerase III subunit [Chloroherpetonaceae bacterium]MDW8465035.1 DNA polymerase III subunit [Chloroherpetonaceae bacterium]
MSWQHILGQKQQIETLRRTMQAGRLPNAYLFVGPEGVGKDAVALELAKTLNCLSPSARRNAEACDQCESCQAFAELLHPNLEYVFPVEGIVLREVSDSSKEREKQEEALAQYKQLFAEKRRNPYFKMQMEKSMGILAEQIEELIRKAQFKPESGMRIFLISQADRMNTTAANRLLKILEEPPPFVLFILTTARPDAMLPTIVSRCQLVRFSALSSEEMLSRLAGGADSAAQVRFAVGLARGNFFKAQQLLCDPTALQLRNRALDWLRTILAENRLLERIRFIEELTKQTRDAQLEVLSALLLIFQDAQRVRQLGAALSPLVNTDISETIEKFVKAFPNANFDAAAKLVEESLYSLMRNANPQLTLSALSIQLRPLLRGLPFSD